MRIAVILIFALAASLLVSCDLRSETAKQGVEKFISSPTPEISPRPTPTPVDPADVVEVDTSVEGDKLTVNTSNEQKTVNCNKFNRVAVNGDLNTVTIRGVCSQVMINGDGNKITVDAGMEFVINGTSNEVRYARYANGKEPVVVENRPGNLVEKVPAASLKSGGPLKKAN